MAEPSFILRPQTEADRTAIERLNARAFGPGRFARSAYRLREDMPVDPELSFVAYVGPLLAGSNQMTRIRCGLAPAVLLGPLTVDPAFRSGGIGEALVLRSLEAARREGHSLVLLVGDLSYYEKWGFKQVPEEQITFCGPVDPARFLYLELIEGVFGMMTGKVRRGVPATWTPK